MPAGKLLPASEERHLLEIMPKKGHLGWPARLNHWNWRFVRLLKGGAAHPSERTNTNVGALLVFEFQSQDRTDFACVRGERKDRSAGTDVPKRVECRARTRSREGR